MLCCQVVCDFCRDHLEVNKEAFADPRLELIIDDAKAQLEVCYLDTRRCCPTHGTSQAAWDTPTLLVYPGSDAVWMLTASCPPPPPLPPMW